MWCVVTREVSTARWFSFAFIRLDSVNQILRRLGAEAVVYFLSSIAVRFLRLTRVSLGLINDLNANDLLDNL